MNPRSGGGEPAPDPLGEHRGDGARGRGGWTDDAAAEASCAAPCGAGRAATRADAWTAALAAGRTALLAGGLDDLTVAVDDALLLAHYHPALDNAGVLDEFAVTAAMVEIYQSQTSTDIAGRIAGAGR